MQKKLDRYEERLTIATKELKECQQKHNLNSCLKCKKIIGCRIRNEYVDAVYKSMNKGQGGGFEF
ncbi:hypothetical protein NitYY0826_C1019 [Nitratiruptor sp. YY08-26]|uniref:hypothetical protein n=1 Tax=unclassified Nitratiruptor TaxID=2624044 RepID=UPI0019168047|nr:MULTISPECIES: hypothetical protein [unclassified Nitratiruptor]BCD62148.1 hypothetical protein NitYY0813_C1017 [Nitratiruptor sp. YY08-13]BCD66084.1 hypothetical protein NitYY0826_C1019 [Nitratiruptor sp. YY08-26]